MKKLTGSILALFAMASFAQASNLVYSGIMAGTNGPASSTAAASTATYTMDVNASGGDLIGAQLNYSSAVIPSFTFTDGSVSTFTLTITSTQGISGILASDTLTVLTTNFAQPSFISVNGFYIPTASFRVNFASNTAIDMAAALDLLPSIIASTTSATTVTVKCATPGTFCNSQTLSVIGTSSITASSPTFQGGQNAGTFSINGVFLTAGVDYAIGATAAITATNAAAAINANSKISPLVTAAAANTIVFTTANFVGAPYAITTSTQSALTISPFTSSSPATGIASGTMAGGSASAYTIQTPTITIAGHGLTTGYAVLYTTSSGVALTPLAPNTTYYAIRIDANNFALATSLANAQAGTFITFTSSQTKTASDTFKIAPTVLSGTAIFQLQASNDGINWGSITTGENGASLSNVTFSTPYTTGTTLWDIGKFDHRYLRLNYLGPTFGGVNFAFYVNQKSGSTAR